MTLLHLRVTPWDNLSASRTLALGGSHTLDDLHAAIQRGFGYTSDEAYAFFMNGHAWDAEFGIWSSPEGGKRATADATLDSLRLRPNKRFLYLFDFGDEHQFDVRVALLDAAKTGPATPQVVESVGELDDDDDDDAEHEPHAHCGEPDAALAELAARIQPFARVWDDPDEDDDESEGDDELELEAAETTLDEEYTLALELLKRTDNDPSRIHTDVEHAIETGVFGWLQILPYRLATAGKFEPALALSEPLLAMTQSPELRACLPRFLAGAGRTEEARRLLDGASEEDPEDPEVQFQSGLAWLELGEPAKAEQCLREALNFAGSQRALREQILSDLVDLLEASGRPADAQIILRAEHTRASTLQAAAKASQPS